MNMIVGYLISLFLYPGILFALLVGWLLLWLAEAVATRRQGTPVPRLRQPVQDVVKLFSKVASFSAGAEGISRVLPLLAALAPLLALVLLPIPGNPAYTTTATTGDLLAVVLLLLLPPLAPVFLGQLSGSPYGRLAAQRAIRPTILLMVGLLLSTLTIAAERRSLDLSVLVKYQPHPSLASLLLDALAGALFCTCLPGLLTRHAVDLFTPGSLRRHLELVAGPSTDLAGADLALLRLSAAIQHVASSSLLAVLFILPFVPGGTAAQVIVYLATLAVSTLLVGGVRSPGV